MAIKHNLPDINVKLARLDEKAKPHLKWEDTCSYDMRAPEVVGWTVKGGRVVRRILSISRRYGIEY